MGWRLAEEVQEHAPAELTWRELYVAVVLAHDANDETRIGYPGIDSDPAMVKRLRLPDHRAAMRVIDTLIKHGVLQRIQRGNRGTRAGFQFLPLAPEKGGQNNHTDDTEKGWSENAERVVGSSRKGGQNNHPSPQSRQIPPSSAEDGAPLTLSEGGGGTDDPSDGHDLATAFVDELPFDRAPSARQHRQLVGAVASAFADGWVSDDLRRELERDLGDARSRVAVWLDRLRPENLRLVKRLGGTPQPNTPDRPAWCGACDERTRLVDLDDGRIGRCPHCHPHAVLRPPAAA